MGVRNHLTRPVRRAMAVAVMSACASSAFAIEFETDGGWRGSLNTTIGMSSAWRVQDPDKSLIQGKNAAAAGLVSGVTATDKNPGVDTTPYSTVAIQTAIATGFGAAAAAGGANPAAIYAAIPTQVATALIKIGVSQELAANAGASAQPAFLAAALKGVSGAALQGAVVGAGIGGLALGAASRAGVNAGYLGGAPTDDANLNYFKGDRYSTNLKVLTELALSKGDTGGLLRLKGWYDQALNSESVPWGHQGNGFAKNKPMSDDGADLLNRFEGVALLDAYAYTGFDIGGQTGQIRVGRQAVNWGESLFIQGINQLTPLDVAALRKAGTEIKEALLPVWSAYGNIGLPGGASVEGFYQFKWEASNIDSCGSYWSPVGNGLTGTPGPCNMATSVGFGGLSNRWAYLGGDGLVGGLGGPTVVGATSVGTVDKASPSNSGQWGLSLRFPVEAIDTEFGLYAMNIHSRTPILSGKVAALGYANFYNASERMVAFWEYPEDIKIYGLSASTTVAGWSVGAEVSFQKDVPVQVNGNDMLVAGLTGGAVAAGQEGPAGARVRNARLAMAAAGSKASAIDGAYLQGYDRFDKTQFQVNGVYMLPSLIGATSGLLVAETGFQWNNVPDNNMTNIRYGRSFIYGFGSHDSYFALNRAAGNPTGNNCATLSVAGTTTNPQPTGCLNDGYVTDFAWGYRIRASLDYPSVFESSWTATPIVYFAHDVKGYSIDTQFNEGRKTLGLGLRMSLNKVHSVDLNYTTFANSAKYDATRDRDNVSIAYSYTF